MRRFWYTCISANISQRPKNDLKSDSTKHMHIFRYVIYVIPKKLHARKRKKVTEAFLRWPLNPLLTDRQTEEDNSALEKLRCHSAGGDKAYMYFIMSKMHNFWNKATRCKCGINVV